MPFKVILLDDEGTDPRVAEKSSKVKKKKGFFRSSKTNTKIVKVTMNPNDTSARSVRHVSSSVVEEIHEARHTRESSPENEETKRDDHPVAEVAEGVSSESSKGISVEIPIVHTNKAVFSLKGRPTSILKKPRYTPVFIKRTIANGEEADGIQVSCTNYVVDLKEYEDLTGTEMCLVCDEASDKASRNTKMPWSGAIMKGTQDQSDIKRRLSSESIQELMQSRFKEIYGTASELGTTNKDISIELFILDDRVNILETSNNNTSSAAVEPFQSKSVVPQTRDEKIRENRYEAHGGSRTESHNKESKQGDDITNLANDRKRVTFVDSGLGSDLVSDCSVSMASSVDSDISFMGRIGELVLAQNFTALWSWL